MQTNRLFSFFRNEKSAPYLWILFHLTIPLVLLISVFIFGPVGINTSLFDMLPQSSKAKSVMEADKILGERNGREAVILCAAEDFSKAKQGAAFFYEKFKNSKDIESMTLFFDSSVIDEFYRYLFDYRFMIASDETLNLLESGGAQEIAYDALAGAFGVFNFFPLDNIEKDPFLLAERRISGFLNSTLLAGAMTLKDDVIYAEKDGINYVLIRMTLSLGSTSVQAGKNAVAKIYTAASEIKIENKEIEFYFSGIPFHSYESSSGAQMEISVISSITLALILLLFIFVFRSPSPVIASIAAIGISIAMAACAALLVFREIHIITFVFGTTLIGTCVDYSVHFFVHWKKNNLFLNGAQIRSHIIKNITMSFISTQICFIVFFFAPFVILKQFAVFSIIGLASSYLTFFCIYPRLKVKRISAAIQIESAKEEEEFTINNANQTNLKHKSVFMILDILNSLWQKKYFRPVLLIVFIITIGLVLVFNSSNVRIKNDISSLYTMSEFLLESEKRAAQVLDYGSPGWYFIVSGSTINETLENEEKLTLRLQEEIDKGNMGSFLSTTVFVPSQEKQTRIYSAMQNLLPLSPIQFEYLGFPPDTSDNYENEFKSAFNICLPDDAPSQFGISNLWIGKSGGRYYSCVMPLNPKDESIFRSLAGDFENVHFMNKAKDISADMDTITRTMLLLFLIAYIIVSVIIFKVFPLRDSIKICSVPLLLVMSAAAVLAANNIPIGFFSAAALVLVFGLSLDYIFFMTGIKGKEERKITFLGVTLSFLTTLLSFGALSLSSFMPVHLFGLTVCAGLGAAFISSIILQSREKSENQSNSG